MTDQSYAETQASTSAATGVLALLKAKPGVTRERVVAIMPAEYARHSNSTSMGKSANGTRGKMARGAFFS